jgi:ABC-type multidrug transport system ATPase subunit
MTGRESLVMYARLWGVLEQDINEYVEAFLHSVHLEPIADQFIHTYRWDIVSLLLSVLFCASIV